MTTKLLAAALLFTAMPTVAHAGGGAKDGWSSFCIKYVNGVPKFTLCKG
jgi:hypothetical protein